MTIFYLYAQSTCYIITGLSTDTKPTTEITPNVPNGSLFTEIDTGLHYSYNGSVWSKVSAPPVVSYVTTQSTINTANVLTDVYSHTLAANTLNVDGRQSLDIEVWGSVLGATQGKQIKFLMAGNLAFDTGSFSQTTSSVFILNMKIYRTTAGGARVNSIFSIGGDLAGTPPKEIKQQRSVAITWANANILKLQVLATAGSEITIQDYKEIVVL